jgi:hypothetical protein
VTGVQRVLFRSALLVPAEAAVGDGLRANILEDSQAGVLLGDLKLFSQHLNFDKLLVVAVQRTAHGFPSVGLSKRHDYMWSERLKAMKPTRGARELGIGSRE